MSKSINTTKLRKEMQRWPKNWAGFKSDVPIGKKVVQVMQPFVLAMLEEQLSYTTINRHLGNLFLLGGEIIRRFEVDQELKELPAQELVLKFLDDEGGPYCRHVSTEAEQKTFDATCKKLYRYMQQPE